MSTSFFWKKKSRNTFLTDLFNSFQIQYKIQPQAQSNKPPHIANNNAFLGDVVSTCRNTKFDDDAPISAGFYRQEKGTYDIYPFKINSDSRMGLFNFPPLTVLFFVAIQAQN